MHCDNCNENDSQWTTEMVTRSACTHEIKVYLHVFQKLQMKIVSKLYRNTFFLGMYFSIDIKNDLAQGKDHSGYITVVEPYQRLCYRSNFSKLLLAGWFEIWLGCYLFHSAKWPII